MASGINWDDSNIYGSILGLLFQTYVETEDGFARIGVSVHPIGILMPLVLFFLRSIIFGIAECYSKWQYVPSEWTGKPVISRPRTFIDDYNSSTFWYSIKVNNVIPHSWQKYWALG